MRSRARWRELLGVLGGLVDLGHLGVLDQVVDGLGATDGLADGRHAVIGDEVRSGAQAGIAGSIRKGHITVQGSPAIEAKNFARSSVVYKKLPEMYADVNHLKKEIEELKEILNKKK